MSKRSPLTPAERKQILKMHGDGYTQLMIANQVGVHRHSVANVIARSAESTPAELREQIAQLKAELAARNAELLALRRLVVPAVQGGRRVAEGLAPWTAASADERRALSLATAPRPAPSEVAERGLVAMTRWWGLEKERQRCGYPLPMGPYHGWTEVRMRAELAGVKWDGRELTGSFDP
jgi:hypothetical protein